MPTVDVSYWILPSQFLSLGLRMVRKQSWQNKRLLLALFVRSLDGSCRRIEVPLAKTMAEIIGEPEVGLPDLHEVKLV